MGWHSAVVTCKRARRHPIFFGANLIPILWWNAGHLPFLQHFAFLQPGDLMFHINGESSLGLTHAQVLEWIHTGGPGSTSCYAGLFETHPSKSERARAGGPRKGDSGFPRGEGSGICEE